jgi:hypothetical protein
MVLGPEAGRGRCREDNGQHTGVPHRCPRGNRKPPRGRIPGDRDSVYIGEVIHNLPSDRCPQIKSESLKRHAGKEWRKTPMFPTLQQHALIASIISG